MPDLSRALAIIPRMLIPHMIVSRMLISRVLILGALLLVASSAAPMAEVNAQASPSMQASPTAQGAGAVLIEADPDAGFNYPYYLSVPDSLRGSASVLVETNGSRLPSDNLDVHLKEAKREATEGLAAHVSKEVGVPLVKPVFPKPVGKPVDWTHTVDKIDLQTMQIESGPLKRVDLQLLAMVEDARKRLEESGLDIEEGIMLNGFSSPGQFANRFAALHPGRVISVTAGGINGMPILPYSEVATRNPVVDGGTYPLSYHVGTAGIKRLTGSSFDREAFRDVRQFLYLGGEDTRDALLYPDAYTTDENRLATLLALGPDIHAQRFPRAKAAYRAIGAKAVFRIYEGAGHTPEPAVSDVVEFHRRALRGDPVESVREDLGGNVPDPDRDVERLFPEASR